MTKVATQYKSIYGMAPTRFQEALDTAIKLAKQHRDDLGEHPVLVRDLYGRIRIALQIKAPKDDETTQLKKYQDLAALFCQALGKFSDQSFFLYKDELFDPDAIFNSPDKITISPNTDLFLLDRQITGHDWLRQPIASQTAIQRITLFSIKGEAITRCWEQNKILKILKPVNDETETIVRLPPNRLKQGYEGIKQDLV
jgi:hypothetical protein